MKYLTYKDLFIVPTLETDDFSQHAIYTGMLTNLRNKLKICVWAAKECKCEDCVDIPLQAFTGAVSIYNIWAINSNAPYMPQQNVLKIESIIGSIWKREVNNHE